MTAKLAFRYFDPEVHAEIFEYAIESAGEKARVLWYRTTDNIVRMFWCRQRTRDDDFSGLSYDLFKFPRLARSDIAPFGSNTEPCTIYFDDDVANPDDNPVGIALKVDQLQAKPQLGERLSEYFKRSADACEEVGVIAAALIENICRRLGSVPILPAPEVKFFG